MAKHSIAVHEELLELPSISWFNGVKWEMWRRGIEVWRRYCRNSSSITHSLMERFVTGAPLGAIKFDGFVHQSLSIFGILGAPSSARGIISAIEDREDHSDQYESRCTLPFLIH